MENLYLPSRGEGPGEVVLTEKVEMSKRDFGHQSVSNESWETLIQLMQQLDGQFFGPECSAISPKEFREILVAAGAYKQMMEVFRKHLGLSQNRITNYEVWWAFRYSKLFLQHEGFMGAIREEMGMGVKDFNRISRRGDIALCIEKFTDYLIRTEGSPRVYMKAYQNAVGEEAKAKDIEIFMKLFRPEKMAQKLEIKDDREPNWAEMSREALESKKKALLKEVGMPLDLTDGRRADSGDTGAGGQEEGPEAKPDPDV